MGFAKIYSKTMPHTNSLQLSSAENSPFLNKITVKWYSMQKGN